MAKTQEIITLGEMNAKKSEIDVSFPPIMRV